ncbi:hypothetical protein SEUCBS140593_008490 [Sporothrix eucalyptigena]|uniref:DNA endonuclease activator Ctp1 C-terminal domain-containing protein n=1 Tax=Sporothrix eucalyptigena TaxID=1812306 RepID=A0ABP0CLW0_9PEZI
MSDTSDMGRQALMQAIGRAVDRVYDNMEATEELLRQDDQWQRKYSKLQDESQETQERLEAEIGELRDQIAILKSAEATRLVSAEDAPTAQNAEKPGIDTTTKSDDLGGEPNDSSNLIEELQKGLEKSRLRHEAVKVQLDEAVALVRKRKAETLSWVKYADSLEMKIKKMEKKKTAGRQTAVPPLNPSLTTVTEPSAPPPNSISPKPALLSTMDKPPVQVEVAKPSLSASFSSSAASSFLGYPAEHDNGNPEPELPPQEIVGMDDSRKVRTEQGQENPNQIVPDSTQSEPSSSGASQPELPTPRATDSDDIADRVAVKNEPPSDGPEIIWERVTKKPRRDGQSDNGGDPQTPQITPLVKRESSGSTQRMLGMGIYRESQESIDLDEGQLTVQTPRKRQLYYERQALLEREGGESGELSSQGEMLAAGHQSATRQATLPPNLIRPPPPLPGPLAMPYTLSTPLAPISSNVRRGVNDKDQKMLKRGIESLAEDNQAYHSLDGVYKKTTMEPPSTAKLSRLDSLLNKRKSDPSPLSSLPRPTPATVQRFHNDVVSPVAGLFGRPPPTRILPHLRDDDTLSLPRTPSAAPRGSATTPVAAAMTTPTTRSLTAALLAAKADSAVKKTPALRGRPIDQLKMDDFKINPALNNGETFAYKEVVRSRADRANLAGCTDPQCCGKAFRGMATSELDAAGPYHIRRSESTVLMERHLGDEAFMLAQMDPDEKRELWIEARTKELADKYGKHRHRYHRRASPPGFWDTDFPTTQDEENNRAEAEKVERIAVQERYREAMRPGGGRWLFRDE